ncbi:thiamine phosphate synthase [Spongorhabdus nitratireducens]
MTAYPQSGLYAITDEHLLPDDKSMYDTVERMLEGGAGILQYRDKSDDHDKRLRQALMLKELCHRYQIPFIINDDIELTLESGADGVHLGQQDDVLMKARNRLGQQHIIGISCNGDLNLARTAQRDGADYVAFGRMFPTRTKADALPCELSVLSEASTELKVPIVAIGGITLDNAPQLVAAGARQLAVINNLITAPDVTQRARAFCDLLA